MRTHVHQTALITSECVPRQSRRMHVPRDVGLPDRQVHLATANQRHCLSHEGCENAQGNGSVSVTKAVETQGKGSVLATKTGGGKTQDNGSVFTPAASSSANPLWVNSCSPAAIGTFERSTSHL